MSNLRFAQAVEPRNPDIAKRLAEVETLRAEDGCSLPSNLALERLTNPFLRLAQSGVAEALDARGGGRTRSAMETFTALRGWKDNF